jgi:hypothetical protein
MGKKERMTKPHAYASGQRPFETPLGCTMARRAAIGARLSPCAPEHVLPARFRAATAQEVVFKRLQVDY